MTTTKIFLGSLIADALALPGHWYYDRAALARDYGQLDCYQAPRNPHPDSIFWRSNYEALNEKGEILHDQAPFWGIRGIHYHQLLKAGDNTVNYQLAQELFAIIQKNGFYDSDAWLQKYLSCMLTPGWHRDTYLEEYHRGFFTRYSQGKDPSKCGIRDEHIGGLAQVPALLAALPDHPDLRALVKQHVALTHRHSNVLRAADCLTRLHLRIREGVPIRDAIMTEAGDWFSSRKAAKREHRSDLEIIGSVFSPACYIDQAFPAALYLTWKYHDDFSAGIIANAMVGGDSCHRGAVVGSLLGAANPIEDHWIEGLNYTLTPQETPV